MRGLTRLLLVVALAGCARMAPPPGGPPDRAPPRLIATTPESVAVLTGFDGWAEFQFDEIISEGGQANFGLGTGDLEKLILLSPGNEVPRVDWRRNRIAVRPRGGWKPNTVYRIELTGGVVDLRDNRTDTTAVITLATGGPLPTRFLTGRAVDWAGARPFANALIEATRLPDSLTYRTVADSNGRFNFGPLPEGEFLVAVTLDQDRNRRRGAQEGWDSVRLRAGSTDAGEVWAFQRDTLPPALREITRLDSVTIALTFTQPIHPDLRIGEEGVVVRTQNDSVSADPIGALPKAVHDSVYRTAAPTPPPDSAARPDTAPPRPTPPVAARPGARATTPAARPDTLEQKRPPISNQLVVRVRGRLVPGRRFVVIVRGVRSLAGTVADSVMRTLEVPEAPPPDSTRTRTDSTRTPGDTTARAAARDTTARPASRDTTPVRRPR